ncbi:MAG: Ig-like domain-containing protein, partial [Gemmatimonadota bacterium]|nr:Ig-like domain-containing protein [Gemmatimonadota bacterium]
MQLFSRNKAIVALSLGALALGACGDDVTVPVAPAAPITLSITPPSANMNIGEAVNFAVQISGGTGASTLASCTSSSATVATATVSGSSCRVTAVGAGNATITAAASTGQSAAASVSVAAPAAAISGLQVSPSAANVQVNQTVTIVPTVNKGAAAVAVAYTYASSTASVATVSAAGVVTAVGPGVATITVTATGTGTGFTSTTLTSAAAITVTALPTGMTSLNVSPATLALAAGSTAQIVANAQQPSGAAAATITYGTTAPAVATVSSMGLITAVGAGSAVITVTASSAANANFAAATLSGTVAVTVSPAAQISISGITYGLTLYPVDVNAVAGQIQVNTNLVTNGQLVTAVSAWVCRVGETVPACAARSGMPAAQQSFGTGGAASGSVSLTINTADFTVAPDFGSASVKYNNGQNVIVATVSTDGGLNSANSNLSILNFTNVDGFAARHVAPMTTATTSGGVAYFGGPSSGGRGSISVVPVTYTAGRTIKAATAGVPTGIASCVGGISFTSAATPWTFTYGTSLGSATGANATNVVCTGATDLLDLTAVVSASTYSDNTAGPTATGAVESTFSGNNFLTISSSTTPVAAPASIRVDYAAPTGGAIAIPVNGWLNGMANLTGAGTGNILTLATDANVGLTTSATVRYVRASGGCSIPTDTTTITAATASNDIVECASSNANTVYTAHYYPVDRLGNAGLRVASSSSFGVDRTAPVVRYSADIAADRSINPGEDNAFQVEALDERSGLTSAASASFTRTLRASTSTTNWATATSNFCATAPPTLAAASSSSTGFGTLFISAPNCAYAATSAYAGTTMDGYSIAPAITVAGLPGEGYYTYRARVADEAGNTAVVARQAVLVNTISPTVTAAVMIAPITSTYTGPFTGTFQDQVETQGTGLRMQYGALELAYPMSLTSAV